jgi:hypothetical protein
VRASANGHAQLTMLLGRDKPMRHRFSDQAWQAASSLM